MFLSESAAELDDITAAAQPAEDDPTHGPIEPLTPHADALRQMRCDAGGESVPWGWVGGGQAGRVAKQGCSTAKPTPRPARRSRATHHRPFSEELSVRHSRIYAA